MLIDVSRVDRNNQISFLFFFLISQGYTHFTLVLLNNICCFKLYTIPHIF